MEGYKKIAIVGASGVLGKPLVKQLARAGYELTLISRDSAKIKEAFGLLDVKFKEAEADDAQALREAFTGIDAVVSVVGSLALASQLSYIDAAVEAGVQRFIPSEFGCDTQAPYLLDEMIFTAKRGVAAYLKELADLGKISYTLISTGLFFTLDLPFPVAGIDHKMRTAKIIGDGNALFSLTHLDDIGRYVTAILRRPEETKNRTIRIAGDTQTANALLGLFEKQSGKKFKVTHENAVVFAAMLKSALDHKKYGTYFANAIDLFTGDGRAQINRPVKRWANGLDNAMFDEVRPLTAEEIIAGA